MSELRFDERVAVVTGAGNGLGRSHALALGARGAKVVVNDLGGGHTGEGKSGTAADAVVAEIIAAGGLAIANYDSVENGDKIVKTAIDTWGRIDILVNNAGILRDVSFQKMSEADWDLVYRVHVLGAFRTTQAAWGPMRKAGYGRILFTASAAGIYGNFGQANYAMAKLGLVGLGKTLAIEGQKNNVLSNVIAPIAGSRMTETILPKELLDALKPEYVSPLLLWLAHETCEENGSLFEVGGGYMGKLRWERTQGKTFNLGRPLTPESVQKAWGQITDFDKSSHPNDVTSAMGPVLSNATSKSLGGNDLIDVDLALGAKMPERTSTYDTKDLALYALAVGAARNPLDKKDLRYVYEMHADGFWALPTFAVIPALDYLVNLTKEGQSTPGLNYGFERILHGEQFMEIVRPFPIHEKLSHRGSIKAIYDKGKNAVVVMEIITQDSHGDLLARNEVTTVIRGAGGWGGDRGPQGESTALPGRAPDAITEEHVNENQALFYRLTGDINPLHADPEFAKTFGFDRPILHGLCTLGIAARHVIAAYCDNDPRYFKNIRVRFADSVFPGETLVTEMWKEGSRVVFQVRAKERNKVVLSAASIELFAEIPEEKPARAVAAGQPALSVQATPTTSVSNTARVFDAIGDYVSNNPDLTQQIQTVYLFKLSNPESLWTLDLKNGGGSVVPGVAAKADCTLELIDSDFQDMTSGKADPQKLYFAQKLKISGNLMASQKLGFLQKLDRTALQGASALEPPLAPTAAAKEHAASASQAPTARIAKELFETLAAKASPPIGLLFSLKFVVDGASYQVAGADPQIAATLTLDDATLTELAHGGALSDLYQRGKVRIDGDIKSARDLSFLKGLL